MIAENPSRLLSWPTLAALTLACAPAIAQTTLFLDDFDGNAGSPLNGTTPDVTTGESWVAGSAFNADGTTNQAAGSATLAFNPVDGEIYTLEATYGGLSAIGEDESDWFALGFVNGQSDVSGTSHRFITGSVAGVAWMMHRGDVTLGTNQSFLGTGQLGAGNFGLGGGGGENTSVQWALTPDPTSVDMRVVLDTTGGFGNWTATFYAKATGDAEYIEIRPTEPLLPGAVITAVGLSRSNDGVEGTVERFSLSSSGGGASASLRANLTLEEGNPRIEVAAPDLVGVDLYRSVTAEPGTWGTALATGLANGEAFIDTNAPEGKAFYILVTSGGSAP
jgi:hypothetical protein